MKNIGQFYPKISENRCQIVEKIFELRYNSQERKNEGERKGETFALKGEK